MNNKKLEERLKKKGEGKWIKIIEMCENEPTIKEIHIKESDLTSSPILNRMIETYLKELQVIMLTDDEVPKNICKNKAHKIPHLKYTRSKKIKRCRDEDYHLFSVDENVYVVCPDCNNFEEL